MRFGPPAYTCFLVTFYLLYCLRAASRLPLQNHNIDQILENLEKNVTIINHSATAVEKGFDILVKDVGKHGSNMLAVLKWMSSLYTNARALEDPDAAIRIIGDATRSLYDSTDSLSSANQRLSRDVDAYVEILGTLIRTIDAESQKALALRLRVASQDGFERLKSVLDGEIGLLGAVTQKSTGGLAFLGSLSTLLHAITDALADFKGIGEQWDRNIHRDLDQRFERFRKNVEIAEQTLELLHVS